MPQLKLGDISIDVVQKDIKNIHLSVHPPTGRVRISAPLRLNLDTIRIYAVSKISWIKKQQTKLLKQKRETRRDYINLESHYYLGKRYLLKVIEYNNTPNVIIQHNHILLYVRNHTVREKRKEIMNNWYRQRLKEIIPDFITKWEKILNVTIDDYGIKRMKTRWGTCNRKAKRIWLNLELAKKPIYCIEYIIVHEMVHLLERYHNEKFIAYMNKYLPRWKYLKEELNSFPLVHENWGY
jgi:hypothetical protein